MRYLGNKGQFSAKQAKATVQERFPLLKALTSAEVEPSCFAEEVADGFNSDKIAANINQVQEN